MTDWPLATSLTGMKTIAALLEALGGRPAVAAVVGLSTNSITYWSRRGRIPPEYWLDLIAYAAKRGVEGVDHDLLLRLHRPRNRCMPDKVAA